MYMYTVSMRVCVCCTQFDLEQFDEINMDLRWLKGKSSKNKKKGEDSVDFSSSEQDEKDLERLKVK